MDVSTPGDVSASAVKRARPAASLSVKLGFAVFCAMASLAVVATAVFSNRLTQAYEDAGRAQLQAIVTTYDQGFRVTALEEPGKVEERIANLRRLNKTIHKVSVSWHDVYGATLVVQDGHNHDPDGVKRDVTTSVVQRVAGSSNLAPIDLPVQPYTEVRAPGGAHYGKLTHLIKRGGTPRAMLELHYDLKALDEALAYDKRTVAGVALLAALTLTLVVNLFLGRAMLAPLQRMRAAAHRLGAGDRGTRLRWKRRDEIGLLAQDFDRMAAELDGAQQHLESLALTDPLTGLLNHRAFKERLEQELRRAEREKYALAVVALDVDNFKEINDRWGHAAGDEGLRVLAGAFRVHLRPSDVSGRVGGDEFCLAVVRSTAEEAEQVVDRLRDHIAKLEIGPAGQTLTISAGISEFPRHSLAREELIHLADGAMYWAKSRGRDRTCIYSADSTFALSAEELAAQAARDGLVNTVHALAKAVDAKDGYTSMHSMRVGRYAAAIARKLGFDEAAIEVIRTAGVLHDVGKIGISDTILQKSEGLTEEEAATMRRHSELGRDIIAGAGMTDIADMVLDLHERWDGGGYPRGIAGEQIRLESRILHAADALEAMTSSRVYRAALSTEDAIEEIAASSGTQIDPLVADVLLDLLRSGELCPEGNLEDADLALVDGPSREA